MFFLPTGDKTFWIRNFLALHKISHVTDQVISHNKEQVSHQTKKIQNQKFITALVKQHSSSDMRTMKKHSITSNTKLIQNYQKNTEYHISKQKFDHILENFGNP